MPRDSMTVATSEKMEQTADSEHHQAVTDSTSCKKTQLDVVMKDGQAFTQKLDPKSLEYFNTLTEKTFSEQAIAFLNAYWEEIGDQAEFIYSVAWETMKYADMHTKGMSYVHLYDEGNYLDFNIGLYFFEKLCKQVLESKEGERWRADPHFKSSLPEMQTAIVRKKELREKVDVNFDGKVSFLEYLLYQYREKTSPQDFTDRSMKLKEEHPEILKAKQALKTVNETITKLETEKQKLTEVANKGGVKGMGAKHELAIMEAGPLASELDKSLISAEAAARIVSKQFKGLDGGDASQRMAGSVWWMNKEIEVKKQLYARKSKATA